VDPHKRGQYSAWKEMISLISGIFFSLAVGFAVDRFEAAGKLRGAFLFIAGCMLAVCLCNIGSFLLMEERPISHTAEKRNLRGILQETFGCRSYRRALIMACLWEVSKGVTAGFMGTYKTNDLQMTVGTVQIINTASSLARFFVSRPLGKYSDAHTYAKGYRIALYIAAAGFLFNIFAAPGTKWCVVAFSVLYAMSFAGTHQNTYNMSYSFLDEENIVHGIAMTDALRGVCGFTASLAGGRILHTVQAGGNRLFGRTVYGQQILSAISLLLTAATIAYNKFVVSKQKENRK
jgi:Na+/melibiose symporter-like transporter